MKISKKRLMFPLLLAAAAAVFSAAVISGCSSLLSGDPDGSSSVFAAASLTEALEEIAEEYQKAEPDVSLIFNFDSSGTLKTQIQEGAVCDLFLSASPKQMDQLETESHSLLPESRIDLLENQVVLVTPKENEKNVDSFDSLAEHLKAGDILLAMGNSDVPAGQYAEKLLSWYGLDMRELESKGLVTYGSNVKEVAAQVSEGSADAGIIYSTDAFSAGLPALDRASEEMCGKVVYPASVLKSSGHQKEAQDFLDFLSSPKAQAVFERIGFSMAE